MVYIDQERKPNKFGMAGFPPKSKQINIKKEHVDYNHHMLLIQQEITERNEQTKDKGSRNGKNEKESQKIKGMEASNDRKERIKKTHAQKKGKKNKRGKRDKETKRRYDVINKRRISKEETAEREEDEEKEGTRKRLHTIETRRRQ